MEKGVDKFIDTYSTPPQHLTVRGSVIFKNFSWNFTIMTSRPSANTQKYLEGCNFANSVPEYSLLNYDFYFCVFFPCLSNGQKGEGRIYLGAAHALQQM